MNRKGFTLIELLAVIVVLGIVLVVTLPSLGNVYKNGKLKSEEAFVNRLSQVIDGYVKLNSDNLQFTNKLSSYKKTDTRGEYNADIYQGKLKEWNRNLQISDIISSGLLKESDYVNAGNKTKSCNKYMEISVYRDSDFVYCYKVRKDNIDCLTDTYKTKITGDYAIDTCIWE